MQTPSRPILSPTIFRERLTEKGVRLADAPNQALPVKVSI